MLKVLPSFFFFLLLLLPAASFGAEQEPHPPGILTVQEYTEFLCATAATDAYSLYNEKMGDDLLSACIVRNGTPGSYTYEAIPERADDPVPYVSRLSAKRYCNWFQNGQPEGPQDETTTERGAYTLDGMMNEDPEREEGATYFLPTSTNNEIDPSLASNLTTYIIITHLGDSFRFSNTSSQDETAAWTVGGVIGGVVGVAGIVAAVLHYRGGIHGEEPSDDHYVDSADRTAQARREEETQEISAAQRGDNDSSALDQEGDISTAQPAPPSQPWANSTKETINNDYLKWIAQQYESKRSLIEQLGSLSQDQRKGIAQQKPEIDSVILKITEHALQVSEYFHLMRAKLSSLNSNMDSYDDNSQVEAWLQKFQPSLYDQYLKFYNSRTLEEFQTTCFSRCFLEPEYCRKQAYKTFIAQLITEHEIGRQYWPYERLLQEWKTQAATAPWALLLEQETELRSLVNSTPAWKRATRVSVQRQSSRLSFKSRVDIHGDVVKTEILSDKLSPLSPTKRRFTDQALSVKDLKQENGIQQKYLQELLSKITDQWIQDAQNQTEKAYYQLIQQRFFDKSTRVPWNTEEEWNRWHQWFQTTPIAIKQFIDKKTGLLEEEAHWRKNFYASLPLEEALHRKAADIWRGQVEATLDELHELLQTAKKIRERDYQITSALPIKREFEILFRTTFSHLHRISAHIEDAPSATLEPLFAQESTIKIFLVTWYDHLNQNSYGLNFVPYHFQMQIKTAIAATQTLADLVHQYQDQALRLRHIAEEENSSSVPLEAGQ